MEPVPGAVGFSYVPEPEPEPAKSETAAPAHSLFSMYFSPSFFNPKTIFETWENLLNFHSVLISNDISLDVKTLLQKIFP